MSKMSGLDVTATDAELLTRMQCGDSSAFSTLYARHHPVVYRFALAYGGNEGVAADVMQEVFLQLIDNHSFDPAQGALRGYLLGMTRNLLKRHWRDAARFAALDDDEADLGDALIDYREPQALVSRAQQHAQLREAILNLPAHYRETLILCELEELDYLEAARVLEVPIGTVRSRLNRARKALCTAMGMTVAPAVLPAPRGEAYELRAV